MTKTLEQLNKEYDDIVNSTVLDEPVLLPDDDPLIVELNKLNESIIEKLEADNASEGEL